MNNNYVQNVNTIAVLEMSCVQKKTTHKYAWLGPITTAQHCIVLLGPASKLRLRSVDTAKKVSHA